MSRSRKSIALYVMLMLLIVISVPQFGFDSIVKAEDSLTANWKFDETSGVTASDSSGNDHIGTVNGATWVAGYTNNCLNFNGTSSYVSVPDANDLDLTSKIKIDIYVNFTSGAGTTVQKILEKDKGTGATVPYGLRVSDTGKIGLFWNGAWIESNALSWSNGTWYHIVVTHDGSSVIFSRDGSSAGTIGNTSTTNASDGVLYIGRGISGFEKWFNGKIDEVGIYLPNTGISYVGYWKYDETSGISANDSSGNGHTGTVNGATWTSGYSNNCLSFNGTNNSVSITDANDLDFTSAIKMDVYVNFTSGAGTTIQKILEKDKGTAATVPYSLRVSDTGKIGLFWNGAWIESNALLWSNGAWYHIVVTHDGSSVTFSRNGSSVGTVSNTSTTNASDGVLYIGRGFSGPERWFNGKIDEVKISLPAGGPVTINSVDLNTTTLRKYEKLAITADITASFTNPFDTAEIEVWADITDPQSNTVYVPAFYYQDYTVNDVAQTITANGNPVWKIRYTPLQTGSYSLMVYVKVPGQQANSGTYAFTATTPVSGAKGFVRVNTSKPNYYKFENTGESLLILGTTMDIPELTRDGNNHGDLNSRYHGVLGDSLPGGTTAVGQTPSSMYGVYNIYKRAIQELAANKATSARIRLDSWWLPLELSSTYPVPGYPSGVPGFETGKYNQYNSFIADKVLEFAQQEGIVVSFCAWNGNSLWGDSQYAWDDNETLIKRRLRYEVARWSYSPELLAFELFNEIGESFSEDPNFNINSTFWQGIISWLRGLDPNFHCIFNSKDGVDQNEDHVYKNADEDFLYWSGFYTSTNKPYTLTEFGKKKYFLDAVDSDPKGYKAHEGMWGTVMGHKSGAWYWWLYPHIDWLYQHNGIYIYDDVFYGVGNYISGENFGSYTFAAPTFTLVSGPGGMAATKGMIGNGIKGYLWLVRTPSSEMTNRTAFNGNIYDVGTFNAGTYTCQWWDTWTGTIIKTDTGLTPTNGKIRISIPDGVTRDIAAKIY